VSHRRVILSRRRPGKRQSERADALECNRRSTPISRQPE
jgi:hypothetical protein